MKILVVDDKEEHRYLLETLLTSSGYEVVSAENGVEALKKLKKDSIDLIISDILMPKMDGFQLCRECKSDKTLKKIPFIMCTATYTAKKDEEFALSLGAERFIMKPIEPKRFIEAIKDVLRKSKKGRLPSKIPPRKEDSVYLKEYSKRLIGQLGKKISQLESAHATLIKTKQALSERVKELSCMYSISKLVEQPTIEIDEIIEGAVKLIPLGWQYPEVTCARIVFDEQIFETDNFKETSWKQSTDIKLYGKIRGTVEVYYLEEKPTRDEGPFLKEERALIKAVSERLGRITERKKAEEEMRAKDRILAASISRAREMEMKNKFISAITHELRTPLISIKGYIDYILSGKLEPLPEKTESSLEVVKRNTERLLNLTENLLDIRRIESGRLQLDSKPMKFREVIDHCVREVQPSINEKKQSLHLEVPKGALMIQGDRIRLSQVVMNLLNNASKFTPEKGDITLRVVEEEDIIRVQVSDTGIGIEKEDLERVFQPFASIKKPEYFKGTGIGLNVSKGLVEAHEGRIWVESPGEGRGATFTFTLPKRKGEEVS